MAVEVGAEFNTFDDLTNAIQVYEAENFVNLIIRDTRKVESAAKRNQRKNYNPAIKYSDIAYCCTYGGKKYICHSTGKRNHKTIKQACPFSMKVRATVDGQRLFIREMCVSHNHQISEVDFRLHPKQRKLDIDSQEEIANLLSFEPDKKLLRDKLMQITGKVILMKDIHNIKTRLLNPKIKHKDIKRETTYSREGDDMSDGIRMNEDENVLAGSRMINAKVETAEMETQTEEEEHEEIGLPLSHVDSVQIDDPSHHPSMFHQQAQQIDSHIHNCFINTQRYHPQQSDVYSGNMNLQTFESTGDYSVNSQHFQQTSSHIISDSISHTVVDPSVRGSDHLQHWTTLEAVDRQSVQESNYETGTAYPYPDHQNNTYSSLQQQQIQQQHIQQQQVQHHIPHISNLQPVPLVLMDNSSTIPHGNQRQDEQVQPQQVIPRSKRRATPKNREKKRRLNSDQKDKETIIKNISNKPQLIYSSTKD